MTSGKFITFEGGEGVGKSTQIGRLADYLRADEREVIVTREPGGTPRAEAIRQLWFDQDGWELTTEIMLLMAARRDHLVSLIWPALERGVWVICDRFVDSSRAYQGMGSADDLKLVDHFYRHVAGDFTPDLTLLLDAPVDISMQRLKKRGRPETRFDAESAAYHQRLRDVYLNIAATHAPRIQVIDASGDIDTISAAIIKTVSAILEV